MGNMKLGPIPFNVCHSQQETCDLPVDDTCPVDLSTGLREITKFPQKAPTYCLLIVFSSVFDGILIVKALLVKGEGPTF